MTESSGLWPSMENSVGGRPVLLLRLRFHLDGVENRIFTFSGRVEVEEGISCNQVDRKPIFSSYWDFTGMPGYKSTCRRAVILPPVDFLRQ